MKMTGHIPTLALTDEYGLLETFTVWSLRVVRNIDFSLCKVVERNHTVTISILILVLPKTSLHVFSQESEHLHCI